MAVVTKKRRKQQNQLLPQSLLVFLAENLYGTSGTGWDGELRGGGVSLKQKMHSIIRSQWPT